MKPVAKFSCLVGAAIAGLSGAIAEDLIPQKVYTPEGVVRFVPSDVSAEELADILFSSNSRKNARKKVLNRSILNRSTTDSSTEVPVSLAMMIPFEFDSARLTDLAKSQLSVIGEMLNMNELSGEGLVVEGHTDITGSHQYNLGLSLRRAASVKRYLELNHHIESRRLNIRGKGETSLIDPEDPKGSINRRVQFTAVSY